MTGTISRRAVLLLVGALLCAAPVLAKDPSPDVKRQLFPAQNALGEDNLDLAETEAKKALAMDPSVTETHRILAEVALRKGNLKAAQESYRKVIELGGADAEGHAGLALVAIAEEDFKTAETEAAAALAADKKSWAANYAQGRVLLAQGKPADAFSIFEKFKGLKTRAEGRDRFEIGMGMVALAEKDPQGAETNFIKARALAPNTIETTMALAQMYEKTGQWGQAANVLTAAEEKFGGSPIISYRLGYAYENQQQWNDALRQYQKSFKSDSTYVPVLTGLGRLFLLDARKTPQAVEVLGRAVAKQPTPAVRRDYGIALTKAGKGADAVPHLEAAFQDDPAPETKVALARAYMAADMIDKGLPMYQDPDVALEASGADLLGVANALIKAKKYEEAKPWLDKAIEKDPKLSDVYARRGFIELVNKNYDGAIQNYQKKIEMDPKNPTSYVNMGGAYLQLGKKPEAFKAYRQATTLAPNSAAVWINLGDAMVVDSTATAVKAFDKALSIEPANVKAKRGKGLALLVQEQYAQSISLLKEATQADPNDAEGLVWLAQGYAGSGNLAEGKNTAQRALKLDPGNKAAQDLLAQLNAGR